MFLVGLECLSRFLLFNEFSKLICPFSNMAFMFLGMIGMLLALRRASIGKLVDDPSGYAF
jgi:hypothetical protein